MRKYTVEKMSETRELITFAELNAKGEKIQIELVKGTYSGHNYSLPYLWKKHGYIDRILETYWSITTYATENGRKGTCWRRYNPQTKLSEDGKRQVINFEWMFEATEENRQKLIAEVERLAFAE